MNDWRGINEFMAVIEHGSFTIAAEHLGTTTSHISKRIAELENRVDVKLIFRTTRVVEPTEEGLEYYKRCKDALSLLAETEASLKNRDNVAPGTLKVVFTGAHQPRYHVAILANFQKKHPHIELDISFTERVPDFSELEFDVAVVLGEVDDKNVQAEEIAKLPSCICAHPAYIKQVGAPSSPQELNKHNCIIGSSDEWQFLDEDKQPFSVKVSGTWHTGSGEIQLQAARFGMGYAQLPIFSATPYIRSGKLQHVLQGWTTVGQPISLVLPSRQHISARAKLFCDFIKQKGILLSLNNVESEAEVDALFSQMEVKLETNKYPQVSVKDESEEEI